jgi:predicted DNA-binding transcriptional regulator AlpA
MTNGGGEAMTDLSTIEDDDDQLDPDPKDDDEEKLDPDPKVAKNLGVTTRTIDRWDEDPKLDFPKAVEINGRKYRRRNEIRAFVRAHLRSARSEAVS